jgi:hypothetical protein
VVKVLIYSSKKIYDSASYEGRAEADIIAYREDYNYVIMKNRTQQYMSSRVADFTLERFIQWAERDEWERDKRSYEMQRRYKDHPIIELMKNS